MDVLKTVLYILLLVTSLAMIWTVSIIGVGAILAVQAP